MPKTQQTFTDLVARVRAARQPGERPIPYRLVAERCGISRQHLYHLMGGSQTASTWVEERVAAGLDVSLRTVQRALKASREAAQ